MGSITADVQTAPYSPAAPAPSEQSPHPVTDFHITGFGPFDNVPLNPTELLVSSLPSYLARAPLPPFARIASRTVIEVAAHGARKTLKGLHAGLDAASGAEHGAPPRSVFLHFGVNTAVKRFELEMQGYNEATFSCPDEAAWKPVKVPIDEDSSLPLAHVRCTQLPVRRLARRLREQGFDCAVSNDAGRFVCNWVYYESLRMSEESGCKVLFVHVPSLGGVGLEKQLSFLRALVGTIAALG